MTTDAILDVLSMGELLQNIFQYCDPRDNLQNALVTKSWSDEALSVLWRDIRSLRPLFSLLAPVGPRINPWQDLELERPIRSTDWVIFHKYSWRVHHILLPERSPKFSDSTLLEIVFTRPPGTLLPNLRSLRLFPSLSHFMPLFLHEGLVALDITMSPAQSHEMMWMLTYLPDRCPHLKRFTLQSSSDGTPVDIRLDDVLTFLPYLTLLRISPIILTPQLMQNIALLPRLEHLNVSEASYGESLTIPSLPHNGFPSITTLKLSHSFKDVALFLESCPLRDLRNLTIIHSKTEPTELYLRVLEASISCCPKLRRMTLSGKMRVEKSLLRLSDWNTLGLWDISMTADAIAHIARILPSLQQLSLSHSSRSRDHSLPPISMLPTLGSMCPRLTRLRIDVDTSPGALAHIPGGSLSFPCLEQLNLGYSYLDSPVTEVAAFLSGILRDGCCLLRARLNDEHDIYERWQPVIDLLPGLVHIRSAEREAAANVGTASMS